MSGRYLLNTNVAIRFLNQEVDLEARRGLGLETFLCVDRDREALLRRGEIPCPCREPRQARSLAVCPLSPMHLAIASRYGVLKAGHSGRSGGPSLKTISGLQAVRFSMA